MAPAADTDERLLALQVKVSEARVAYEELCARHDLMERCNYRASATALRVRRDRAFNELRAASEALAAYVSRRQRGFKK